MAHRSVALFTKSYQSRFDDSTAINDGFTNPNRRWTAYSSPNSSDWVQFSFTKKQSVNKINLYFYNDNGGVKPPKSYRIQYWNGEEWQDVQNIIKLPLTPIADLNLCSFTSVQTERIRITMEHVSTKSFSGLYEVEIY